jgi:hypothetical protein
MKERTRGMRPIRSSRGAKKVTTSDLCIRHLSQEEAKQWCGMKEMGTKGRMSLVFSFIFYIRLFKLKYLKNRLSNFQIVFRDPCVKIYKTRSHVDRFCETFFIIFYRTKIVLSILVCTRIIL